MIETVVLWGRALGILLAVAPSFLVAACTQFVRVLWRTMRTTWTDRPDTRSPQQIAADREQEKKESRAKEAQARQVAHVRKMRTAGGIIGAIVDRITPADEKELSDEPDESS